jgi:TetR/AcrR family transcriptional regulator, transcriptional repressor for nem operon
MPGRPREFDRDEALGAAIQQFWTRGYEGASMNTLMDEMGINKQSAYNAFGDKHDLFMAALQEYARGVGATLGGPLHDPDLEPLQAVRDFLARLQRALKSLDKKGCLMTNTLIERGMHDEAARDFVSAAYRGLEARLTVLLTRAAERGQIDSRHDPQQLARMVLSVMQGAIVLCKARMTDAAIDAVKSADAMLSMK